MTLRLRLAVATCAIAAGALLLPTTAGAQGRRGGRVVHRSTVVVGGGFYYSPFYYDPWYSYQYGWYPPYAYGGRYDDTASLRLQVTPRQTEVFIDGYYAGTVDDFDGMFQRLNLEPGEHDLQLYLPGHQSVSQKIYLQRGATFRVRHTMAALTAGQAEPVRPTATAPPPPPRATQGPGPSARRAEPRDPRAPREPRDGVQASQSNYGTLALRVQPGEADLMIDGEKWEGPTGDTRLVVQLAPGTHVVEVHKDGYRGYMSEVAVRSGETSTLNVALAKQ